MEGPTGVWEIVGRPATAHFHYRNFVTLLHQSMGGNTATKAGTDDDEVEIELLVAIHTYAYMHATSARHTGKHCRRSGPGCLGGWVDPAAVQRRRFAECCRYSATSRGRRDRRYNELVVGSSH